MIPTGISAVVGFLFFVAPGIVWDYLVRLTRPTKNESAFAEASRVALFSLPFSVVSTTIVCAVAHGVSQSSLNVIGEWLTNDKLPSGSVLVSTAVLAVIEVTFAILLTVGTWFIVAPRFYGGRKGVRNENAWTFTFGQRMPKQVALATVRTKDNMQYSGRLLAYTNDLAWPDREITLGQPIKVSDISAKSAYPSTDQFIVIPASNIAAVSGVLADDSVDLGGEPPPVVDKPVVDSIQKKNDLSKSGFRRWRIRRTAKKLEKNS